MNLVLAFMLSFVLIQCEWRETLMNAFAGSANCAVQCCSASCEPVEAGCDSDTGEDLFKCCTTCCFLPVEIYKIKYFAFISSITCDDRVLPLSNMLSDCFHPPETS